MKPKLSAFLPLLVILAACPSPLTDSIINNAKDEIAPSIAVLSPAENSSFGRTIVIDGKVKDTSTAAGAPGRVASMSYEILARTTAQPVRVAADGSFQIAFDTDLKENIVVEIRAQDWNGNLATSRLPLTYEGNDIPTFKAVSGNRKVTMSWDPVPGVTSYTLYFEPSALAPTASSLGRIDNVSSPYVMGNLKNGNVYSFLLRGANLGNDNYSAVVRSVPVSSYDLFPRVTPYFNQIQIEWQPYASISEYEVLRGTSPTGEFRSVSGPVAGGSYIDSGIQQGVLYYYSVKPALYSETRSEVAEAVADPLPSFRNAEVATYTSVSYPMNTAATGSYLYIADYWDGLQVANVSEPSTPFPVTTIGSVISAKDVVVSGGYAYVSHGQSLSVFDIGNPAAPALLSTVAVTTFGAGGQAEGISVYGDWAFVACFNDGLAVVNISDKNNLSVAAHIPAGTDDMGQTYGTAVVNRSGSVYLFVATLSNTVIYQVTGTASAPTLTYRSGRLSGIHLSGAHDLKVVGDYAYLTAGWYLEVWNTAVVTLPVKTDFIQPSTAESVESVDVSGDRAYVTVRDTGFSVIEVKDPFNLSLVQSYTLPGEARGITVSGSYAYIANGQGKGVSIYGIASADAAWLDGTYTLTGNALHLAMFRDYALVTESRNDYALTTVNAVNPSALTYGGASIDYTPLDIKMVGQKAYFAAERSGIMVYDLANLASPQAIPPWYVNLPGGYAWAIDVQGPYAYVVTSTSNLHTVDLSWDGSMSLAGTEITQTVNPSYQAADVVVRGSYAFVANREAGLRVVDVSDPKWPSALPGFGATPGGRAVAVALSGDYALVADEVLGLYVFNVSNPRSAIGLTRGPGAEGPVYDVAVRGNFAYLAKGAAGIQVMDVSNPASPVSVLTFTTPTPARQLAVYRKHVFVIDGATKLYAVNLMP